MPRRREIPKREILPDPKYTNCDVAKFINVLIFMTFVVLAAGSSAALFNEILIFTMLFLMVLVPLTLFRAMVDPHLALGMTYENWSRMTRVAPLRAAGGRLLSGLRR